MKRSLEALPPAALEGRRALVREDFNCPIKDGIVTDDTRLRAALPTIRYLRERGSRVVILSHLGRPKGGPDPKFSLKPVVHALEGLLGAPITFLPDPTAADAVAMTRQLPRGSVAVAENTRFFPGEESNDVALAERFAALGDLYVNDAFGSAHRAHASTEAVAHLLKPAVSGFLMNKELKFLGQALEHPKRPFLAVMGGAKISGKIDLIEALLPKVDGILIGGAMACTFFKAMGLEVGTSLVEADRVALAADLLERAGDRLILPGGAIVAEKLEAGARTRAVPRDGIPAGWAHVRHRSGDGNRLRAPHPRRRHGALERPDGGVRDSAVRSRHAGGGAGDGGRLRQRDGHHRRGRGLRRCGRCGRAVGPHDSCLHWWRRLARVPRGQGASGRCRPR